MVQKFCILLVRKELFLFTQVENIGTNRNGKTICAGFTSNRTVVTSRGILKCFERFPFFFSGFAVTRECGIFQDSTCEEFVSEEAGWLGTDPVHAGKMDHRGIPWEIRLLPPLWEQKCEQFRERTESWQGTVWRRLVSTF